ncbi:MAG TPA: YgjP-like metallopeptidase domain-containing protein [Gallionellaceae bacterium]|nr:YgjP-like metallopeptidase domain-containing protein [Gallionellaceae bacterium]
MNYLIAYSEEIKQQVRLLIGQNRLSEVLLQKYNAAHDIRTDKALYGYVMDLKNSFIRNAQSPSKVLFDNDIRAIQRALGLQTAISRVQGGRLRAKNEIRIASLFKETPVEFLKMIVVHELAHLKERDHNKAFYKLCLSMEPDYHQIEFDLRLYLTHIDLLGKLDWARKS